MYVYFKYDVYATQKAYIKNILLSRSNVQQKKREKRERNQHNKVKKEIQFVPLLQGSAYSVASTSEKKEKK
jgi:hypothetical protein